MAIGSPGIFPKTVGNLVYAADFNNIQGTAEFLLGTGLADSGYGQTVSSEQVAPNTDKITVLQWNTLRTDLLKIRQHQTGVDENGSLIIPTSLLIVDDAFVNQYKTFAETCQTNRLTVGTGQASESDFSIRQRTSSWNGTLTHDLEITFSSSDQARYFFNAGGEIRFVASRVGLPNPPGSKNKAWEDTLSTMGTIKFGAHSTTYTGSSASTVETTKGWYEISASAGAPTTVFVMPSIGASVYTENDYTIRMYKNASDNTATKLFVNISFNDDDTGDQQGGYKPGPAEDESITGTLTSTSKIYLPDTSNVSLTAPAVITTGTV